MRRIKYMLLIAVFVTMCSGVALGKAWRGIEPLHSTRSHVEKLLGPSSYGRGYEYDFENEKVYFQYQTPESACGTKWGFFNVPVNTVLSITVVLKERKPLAEFALDRTYVKGLTCMPDSVNYFNEDEGINYSVVRNLVVQISYTAALKDRRLACPREPRI